MVGVWVARYLGPEKFGIMSHVIAFTTLFAPFGKLGFDGIISRDIAIGKDDINTLMSTSIAFKLFGSIFIVVAVPFYMLMSKDESLYFYLGLVKSGLDPFEPQYYKNEKNLGMGGGILSKHLVMLKESI
ncbi:oligosaccharide flippase family protein [Desulfobacterota bacterium M19]